MVVFPAPGAPVSTNLRITSASRQGEVWCRDRFDSMVTIAVVGPGGVGGLLGAILSRAGHDITFVARESTAAVLNAHGLSVSSIQFGDWVAPAPAAPILTV